MLQKVNSIDIGSYNTKIVCARNTVRGAQVEDMNVVRTPEGAVIAGELADAKELAASLKTTLDSARSFSKETVLVINPESTIFRVLSLPISQRNNIEKVISEEAKIDNLSNYIWDYKYINEADSKLEVALVAVPKPIIDGYLTFVQQAGLKCCKIDFSANAIAKQFGNDSVQKTIAVLDIGDKSTKVAIAKNKILQFYALFPHGGEEITRSIMNVNGFSWNEAREIKHKHGLKLLAEQTKTAEIVKTVVDRLISGIARFFDFYESRSENTTIEKVILTGGSSQLRGLDEYFQAMLNRQTVLHHKATGMAFAMTEEEENSVYLANALGALKGGF